MRFVVEHWLSVQLFKAIDESRTLTRWPLGIQQIFVSATVTAAAKQRIITNKLET